MPNSQAHPAVPGQWTGGEKSSTLEPQAGGRVVPFSGRWRKLSFCLFSHICGYVGTCALGVALPPHALPSCLQHHILTPNASPAWTIPRFCLSSWILCFFWDFLRYLQFRLFPLSLFHSGGDLDTCSSDLPVLLSWNHIQAIPILVPRYDIIIVYLVCLKYCTEEGVQNRESKNLGSNPSSATSRSIPWADSRSLMSVLIRILESKQQEPTLVYINKRREFIGRTQIAHRFK